MSIEPVGGGYQRCRQTSAVFTLQTVPAQDIEEGRNGAAQAGGFSLHAGLDIQPGQRTKLERVCRYVSRPPLAVDRVSLTASGQVRYVLKTPYRDGTTHIVLEPLDLIARLAALVPVNRRREWTRFRRPRLTMRKCRNIQIPVGKF